MKRSPRKSAARWAELVAEFSQGTESERDFCTRRGIKLATLRKWRSRYDRAKQTDTSQPSARFVKVNLAKTVGPRSGAVFCIGTDIRLECPTSYDPSDLAQLVLAVRLGR